jgi:uncharacterized OB-fold protein
LIPRIVSAIRFAPFGGTSQALQLDEAPDYPSIDPDDVSIGMRVQVVFHDVTDEITLPKFAPA